MTLSELHTLYAQHPNVEAILAETRRKQKQHLLLTGLHASAQAMLLASVFQKSERTLLIVAENADDAAYLKSDIEAILAPQPPEGGVDTPSNAHSKGLGGLYLFPSPYRIRQRNHKADEAYAIERTETLNALAHTTKDEGQRT